MTVLLLREGVAGMGERGTAAVETVGVVEGWTGGWGGVVVVGDPFGDDDGGDC